MRSRDLKMMLAIAALLFSGATTTLACMCPFSGESPIKDQVRAGVSGSTAVFVGQVLGIEYRKGILFERPSYSQPEPDKSSDQETLVVRFQVERWWKMALPAEIFLITDLTRKIEPVDELKISDNIFRLPVGEPMNMCHTRFSKNERFLVYADGKADKLQYRYCSRTAPISRASDDLAVLGPGNIPSYQ